jgi:hypothetical protein
MEITAYSLTVTTTRQAITPDDLTDEFGTTVWLYGEYHGSSNKCAIGGADVTMSNGIHIYGGEKFGPIRIPKDETLWVISDDATGLDLRVLAMGS